MNSYTSDESLDENSKSDAEYSSLCDESENEDRSPRNTESSDFARNRARGNHDDRSSDEFRPPERKETRERARSSSRRLDSFHTDSDTNSSSSNSSSSSSSTSSSSSSNNSDFNEAFGQEHSFGHPPKECTCWKCFIVFERICTEALHRKKTCFHFLLYYRKKDCCVGNLSFSKEKCFFSQESVCRCREPRSHQPVSYPDRSRPSHCEDRHRKQHKQKTGIISFELQRASSTAHLTPRQKKKRYKSGLHVKDKVSIDTSALFSPSSFFANNDPRNISNNDPSCMWLANSRKTTRATTYPLHDSHGGMGNAFQGGDIPSYMQYAVLNDGRSTPFLVRKPPDPVLSHVSSLTQEETQRLFEELSLNAQRRYARPASESTDRFLTEQRLRENEEPLPPINEQMEKTVDLYRANNPIPSPLHVPATIPDRDEFTKTPETIRKEAELEYLTRKAEIHSINE
jgi:hypothetical protein